MSTTTDLKDIELGGVVAAGETKKETRETMTMHMLPLPELEKLLETNFESGLTTQAAADKLERDGPNRLTPPAREPWWVKLLEHLFGGFAGLLWVGSVLCFIVMSLKPDEPEHMTLGITLAAVVTLTGIYAFSEDMKAEAVLEGFLKMVPSKCTVKRDGNWIEIDAVECCVGDILKLKNGDNVAADCIVLMSQGVKVDNSSLTGEAEPQKRAVGHTDEVPERSRNVAFFGTGCVSGEGVGVVARIGDNTAIGQIAEDTLQNEAPETLMKIELERFVRIISFIAVGIGVTFLIISLAMGYDGLTSAVSCIGIIVANVPEGLLATVTVALTITALHMADKNVLVKNVETVETLGAVSVIASDKTGTLTQNRMTVRHAVYNSKGINAVGHGREMSRMDVTSGGGNKTKMVGDGTDTFQAGINTVNKSTGKVQRTKGDFNDLPKDLQGLVRVAGLCNHATFKDPVDKDGKAIIGGLHTANILDRDTSGDASESALLKFAHSHCNIDELRSSCKEVACVPFNSANKWMATVHRVVNASGDFQKYTLLVKGAPERVLERCSTHGAGLPMSKAVAADIQEANDEVAENGERVLAFAEADLVGIKDGYTFETDDITALNFKSEDLNFVGLLSLEDPPRPEVPGAVQKCREAGIRVIMVTGDQALTARSIANQVGILRDSRAPIYTCSNAARQDPTKDAVVVTGTELDKFDESDWVYVLSRSDVVFSRTLPHQKQLIVQHLQGVDKLDDGEKAITAEGAVVAVTGDGVNDAPALKSANVGIAMGTGSQVAKDASDMILMDDNFASIVNGIEEGRLIFANLKKSIAYTLTSNIPEILPFLCMIALRIPLGLTTIMILCIDLGTDMLPAIAFAYEVPESNIMQQPPRNRFTENLVTMQLISWSYLQIGIIQAFAAYTAFFYVMREHGFSSAGLLSSANDPHMDGNEFNKLDTFDSNGNCNYEYDVENADTSNGGTYCATLEEREVALKQSQTAFLAAIVVCQVGCGLAAKTRTNSLISQGMSNMVQNYGIFQEVMLIVCLVYVPFLQHGFQTMPFAGEAWLLGVPFAMCIVFYDEWRKYIFRTSTEEDFFGGKEGWFYENFHF